MLRNVFANLCSMKTEHCNNKQTPPNRSWEWQGNGLDHPHHITFTPQTFLLIPVSSPPACWHNSAMALTKKDIRLLFQLPIVKFSLNASCLYFCEEWANYVNFLKATLACYPLLGVHFCVIRTFIQGWWLE